MGLSFAEKAIFFTKKDGFSEDRVKNCALYHFGEW